MSVYLGDFAEDSTVDFKWNTSGANGASITRGTNGTVSVYVGNSATQLTTGVTDSEDFDSLTGVHHCRIDLSSSATYATGSECQVVVSGAAIDGQTVNAVIAHFSIERAGGALALLKSGTFGLSAIKTQTAAIESDTQDLQTQVGTDGAGLTNIPWNANWDVEVQSEVTDALNAYDPPTNAEMEARTLAAASYATATALQTVDDNMDAVLEDTGTTLPGTLSTIAGYIDTEVAAIKTKTDQLTFGVTNTLNVNVTYVNEVEVAGDGESGTEWGPA